MKYKQSHKILRPDAKGRIALGRVAEGVSSYIVTYDNENRIILEPQVEIPAREKWLYDNKMALAQVNQGLKESAAGKIKKKGSFKKYLEE